MYGTFILTWTGWTRRAMRNLDGRLRLRGFETPQVVVYVAMPRGVVGRGPTPQTRSRRCHARAALHTWGGRLCEFGGFGIERGLHSWEICGEETFLLAAERRAEVCCAI